MAKTRQTNVPVCPEAMQPFVHPARALSPQPRSLILRGTALLFVLLVYLPCLSSPFVLDDRLLITESPYSGSLGSVTRLFWEPVTAQLGNLQEPNVFYRPLTFLSLYLERVAWGDWPAGFHLVSLLLHLANATLVFRLLRRIFGGESGAFVLTMLWAVLPAHTEAVTYIAARHDLLATFFYLLALDFYTARDGWPSRFAFLVSGLLSFLAKETALSLPLTAAAYDLCLRPHGTLGDRLKKLCWPLSLLIGFVGARQVLCGSVATRIDPVLLGTTGWHYLRILANPLAYSIDRSADVSRDPIAAAVFLALGVAVVLFTRLRFRGQPRSGAAAFTLLWIFFSYLPVSNLAPLYSFCADRYLYLPLAAGVALLGLHLGKLPARVPILAVAAVLFLSPITFLRANFFVSEEALCRISLRSSPRSPLLNNNLAWIEMEKANLAEAERLLRKALQVSPSYYEAIFNYGRLQFLRRQFQEAREFFEQGTKLRPGDPDSWYQLGLADLALQHPTAAVKSLRHAANLRGNHLGTLYHLALAVRESGDEEQATRILEDLVQRFPGHTKSELLLAELHRERRRSNDDD